MSAMKSIERWFAAYDDGEFARQQRSIPYSVIGPTTDRARLLFTTKPAAVLAAIGEAEIPRQFAMVGRYGLPSPRDSDWIAKLTRNGMVFLGDMDPPDLMTFAWLRERLGGRSLSFVGVSDTFLRLLKVSLSSVRTIALAPSEEQCLSVVGNVLPELSAMIGPGCAKCLHGGSKIELEGALSAAREPAESILRLTMSRRG